MGLIYQPPWARQPQTPVGVRKSSGLTLIANAATGAGAVSSHATPRIATALGIGWNVESPGFITIPAISVQNDESFTFLCAVSIRSISGASNPGLWRSVLGSDTFNIIKTDGYPWIRSNGSTLLNASSGNAFAAGNDYVLAYSVTSAVEAKVAVNGAIWHQANHAVPTVAFTFTDVGQQSGSDFVVGSFPLLAFWRRALSDGELISLTRNPWQLFAPLPRMLWAPAAATGIPVLSAATVTAITATTATPRVTITF